MIPASFDVLGGDQEHGLSLDAVSGLVDQPIPEAAVQEVGPESAPEAYLSSHAFGGGYDNVYGNIYDNVYGNICDDVYDNIYNNIYGNVYNNTDRSEDYGSNSGAVLDLGNKTPIFCRVGSCLYWHTDLKQVRRHRDGHFGDRYGYLCPNDAETCRKKGESFRRRDGVIAHCRTSPACAAALAFKGKKILHWGSPATDEDLVPYDPEFHKPDLNFYGGTGRR